jgi:hypothetical protein
METLPGGHCQSKAQRFQVELLVELSNGTGMTREISVCEVFFVTNCLVRPGEPIELAVVLEYLGLNQPVRLWCRGQVVRADQRDGAVGMLVAIEAFRFEVYQ